MFIIVDGPSASGKDSIIKQLVLDLTTADRHVIAFEETKETTYDRKKILDAKKHGDTAVAQAIIAERKKLYLQKVTPYLEPKTIIIANRGEPSTLAYQTAKNEISMEDVWQMHRNHGITLPDLVVITNCSPEEAARREKARGDSVHEKDSTSLSGKFTLSLENSLEKRRKIHKQYEMVVDFLTKKGIHVLYINTDTMNIIQESNAILEVVKTIV